MTLAAKPPMADLAALTALQARAKLLTGEISAEDLTRACLERVAAREETIQAWAFLDSDHAIKQARAADAWRKSGRPTGPLHGIPVGVKDVFDTRDMPTENGTALDQGRRPIADAAVVAKLREAGAVILGKTVTTELASYAPAKTRNPHASARTPGGSSAGSAAAVAAEMVPLAIGSQTNGSVIRPASFCGVVGLKPSRGLVSRYGGLLQSPPLDSVGVFARTIEDAALAVDAIAGYDPRDAASELAAAPQLLRLATSAPPVTPALAFVRTPVWDRAEEETRAGFAELSEALGGSIQEVALPAEFAEGHAWHRTVMLADMAFHLAGYRDRAPDGLSDTLAALIDEGRAIRAVDYARARAGIALLELGLERLFERFDAFVTPAAPGEAPGLETTGDPAFCTLWTACGVPALTLPLMSGRTGLPIGIQLVGRRNYDGRLLRTARWLERSLLGGPVGIGKGANG